MMLPVVILCGGLGTRLGDLTKNTPKSMLLFNGKPFIEYQLELLEKQGVKDIVLCIGHLGDQIIHYLSEAKSKGKYSNISFTFIREENGTATAVYRAISCPTILSAYESFGVVYGDTYFPDLNINNMMDEFSNKERNILALMSICKNSDPATGDVLIDPNDERIYYHSGLNYPWEDYGFTIFNKNEFEEIYKKTEEHRKYVKFLKEEKINLSELYAVTIYYDGIILPYYVSHEYYEIGSLKGIAKFKELLEGDYLGDFRRALYNAILGSITEENISKIVEMLEHIREAKGRIFFLGVGGSAANASHAVNDFEKFLEIECLTPTDNVSSLTARINDIGWENSFIEWLKVKRINSNDCVFVLSVGGGSLEKNISTNIVKALDYAREKKVSIIGIVGRKGSYTAKVANLCIELECGKFITPVAESMQGVILHLIVNHPRLKVNESKW